MTPGQISRSNDSFARYTAGRANIGDRLRLIRQGKLGLGALFTTIGFDQSGALRAKPSTPSVPAKPTGPGASSRRLLQGAKGLKNLARPGAKDHYCLQDLIMRKNKFWSNPSTGNYRN